MNLLAALSLVIAIVFLVLAWFRVRELEDDNRRLRAYLAALINRFNPTDWAVVPTDEATDDSLGNK